MDIDIPATLYGMVLLEPKYLSLKTDGSFIWIFENLRIWCLLLLNYVVQALFVCELARLQPAEAMSCSNSVALLQFACLFVYEVSMVSELRGSFDIFQILWNATPLGNVNSVENYILVNTGRKTQTGAIMTHDCNAVARQNEGLFDKLKRTRQKVLSPTRKNWSLNHISKCYKFGMFLLVAVPRLALCLILCWIGARYIMGSPDAETLILNTLACEFVVGIDELIYMAFTSPPLQENVENAESVTVKIGNADRMIIWFCNIMLVAVVFTVCVVLVGLHKFSTCPTYHLPWEAESDPLWPWQTTLS